jgi:hypothetical protein
MSQITILKVEKETSPKGYVVTNVSYKNAEGKVKGMKVFPFKEQASVAAAFSDASPGDVYEAAFRKNDKDFWEFAPTPTKTGAKESVATSGGTTAAGATRSGNWETSEERAARQVMIVRQSSLERALQYFELTGHKKADLSEVIALASRFVDFVMGREVVSSFGAQAFKPEVKTATKAEKTGEIE